MTPQLRFPEFTDEWQVKNLGDYFKLQGGYAFQSSQYKKQGIPVIRISNISNVHNFIDKDKLVYHDKIPKDEQFTIKKGDLLVAMSGATTGKASVYNLDLNGYLNQRVGLFRSITKSSYGFLIQFVFSSKFENQLDRVLVAGAQPNISSKDIENFQWIVPLQPEQEKIAEFLTAVDERIAASERKLELLRKYKKGIMQKIFTQQLRFKDEGSQSPEEWREEPLKQLVSVPISDGPHLTPTFVEKGILFLSVDNLQNGSISLRNQRRISIDDHELYAKKCRPQNGDILFGKAASVGNVAIAQLHEVFNVWSPIAVIRINGKIADTRFVYYSLQVDTLKRQIRRYINLSSQENIGMSDINKLLVNLPPLEEQQKIATFLTALDDKIAAEQTRLTAAKQWKKGLLQRMFI